MQGVRSALLAMALVAGLIAPLAQTALAATQTYTVLKDGKPIGEETYRFTEAPDGTLTVEVETRTDVKVLFLDFHFRHNRTEVWEDGRLEALTAKTDDDGEAHAIAMRREDDGWRVEVDGTIRRETPDVLPLTLWTPKVLKRDRLLSIIDAEPFAVTVEAEGPETVNGIETQKYRMTGDVDRTLWYDSQGGLVKVRFTRSGYVIEYVRE